MRSLLLSLIFSLSAQAQWERVSQGEADLFLMAASAPKADLLFVCGFRLDMSNIFTPIIPKLSLSRDGGVTFEEISGTLAEPGTAIPNTLHFLDERRGWLALGAEIAHTEDGGESWKRVNLPAEILALWIFPDGQGWAAGVGGRLFKSEDGEHWSPVESPTESDLRQLFWSDPEHGWALGHQERTEEDPWNEEPSQTFIEGGQLIYTQDGGATWNLGAQFEGGSGSLFFLPDHQRGWLSTWIPERPDAPNSRAQLFSTQDGGQSFQEMLSDTQVGSLDLGFGAAPIYASRFLTQRWADERRGHLAGYAFLMEAQSSGKGSEQIMRLLDFRTEDGGESWEKTDLGMIQVEFGLSPELPPSDGQFIGGAFYDLHRGWLLADKGTVWVWDEPCVDLEECGSGSRCDAGLCAEDLQGGTGGSGGDVDQGDSPPGGSGGQPQPDGGFSTDDPADDGGGDGGCALSQQPTTAPLLLGLLFLILWRARRSLKT